MAKDFGVLPSQMVSGLNPFQRLTLDYIVWSKGKKREIAAHEAAMRKAKAGR